MASSAGGDFGVLPVELRLEVYQYLVVDCLYNGPSTDLKGIYFSCQMIHDELESELIKGNRHLMHAVYKWEKAGFGEVPLMITPSRTSGPKTRTLEISIAVPILNSWIRDSPIFIARSVSFQNMVRSLNRVLAHPCDILNFKFYSARELETNAESVMGAIYKLIAVTKEISHH
jgi:hypothetical protein